ncbi:scopoletin glucosyltransferase-like [Senna tora]|uniref:Glycosyltransferase n=1 Tax=Senna tora TaxID=362788 RepID=A0A834X985_9FABA|nr:scopoletin glucosyltransferase-like [Senna tora]
MHSTSNNQEQNQRRRLHIVFLPFPAHGHISPMADVARLLSSSHGIKATVITTPLNVPLISQPPNDVVLHIKTIDLPYAEAGLPQGCETLTSLTLDLCDAFQRATIMLQGPFEIVADMLFPWVPRSAAKFGNIPTIVFYASSVFSLCASECMRLYRPYDDVSTDSEVFVVPGLPGEIRMMRMEVEDFVAKSEEPEFRSFIEEAKEFCVRSYGLVVNSFYELEHHYFDFYRNVLGNKAWHIGPVSLCKRDKEEASMEEHECLKWLDTKKPNSVIYVCFGSMSSVPESQLGEIAMGLEASGQQFIWVVRKTKKEEEQEEWLLPSGFEERTQGKGLIIRGWAPQVLILEHEAIGAFVTHCGWNSMLEAVSGGVPMITWPGYADQFYNEKLVTQVLRIGVPVGAKKWSRFEKDDVKWDAIEKAVKRIMEGEEAEEMRNRTKMLAQKAKEGMEIGGSSCSDLNALIQDLTMSCC